MKRKTIQDVKNKNEEKMSIELWFIKKKESNLRIQFFL